MKYLIAILIFFAVIFCPAAQAQISKEDALNLFVKGNIAYKDGQYEQALEAYEAILKGGLESGNLYYNLGNCFMKESNIGQAVLQYERALRLIPRDSDLRANYRYALSRIRGFPADYRLGLWQKFIRRFDGFLSLNEMIEFLFFFILLTGFSHIISLYFSWPRNATISFFVICSLVSLILISGMISKVIWEKDQAIIRADTEAKFEPRQEATTYFDLQQGIKVRFLKLEGLWCKVERLDGKKGWVKRDALEQI